MSKHSPITRDGTTDGRWFKGEKKQLQIDIVDSNDTPVDVSSYAMRWVLEAPPSDTDILSKLYPGNDISVGNGDGTNDRVTVTINASDTSGLVADTYRYALWRTDAGDEQVLAEGAAVLRDSSVGD